MLKILGVIISMDIVPTGVSQPTSTSSGVFRQATTLAKPRGIVGGLTNASALAGGGDFGHDGAFDRLNGGLIEVVWAVEGLFSSASALWLAGESPQWLALVGTGVVLFPTWHTLELPLVQVVPLGQR